MVKLFVGNLAEGVDSSRLRNLFLQYVQVQECDVLKNFAFVHVVTDDDAEVAIDKLDKYNLDGREIHIERSTSRLRKEPGMGDKCFTCGATDHKTPNCPQEQGRKKRRGDEEEAPVIKKPLLTTVSMVPAWPTKVGGGSDTDPELPCPSNPELRTLYDQYLDSRTRYFFYRERLSKELAMQPQTAIAPLAGPTHVARFDMTRGSPQVEVKPTALAQSTLRFPAQNYAPSTNYQSPYATQVSASAVSYSQPPSYATPSPAGAPSAPYNTLRTPYSTPHAQGPISQPSAPYVTGSATYRGQAMYATAPYSNTNTSAHR